MIFADRAQAGRLLARQLDAWQGRDIVVLGLPRGGVAVARPIADSLGCPLDVRVARKLGAPGHPEFAIGAVTARGTRVLYDEALRTMALPPGYLARVTAAEREIAAQREVDLRGGSPAVRIAGRTAILVDDGVATGMTMLAAIADVRAERPAALVVAAPVMSPAAFAAIARRVDDVVALAVPNDFQAVGRYYDDFTQVDDGEVAALLAPF